jgi:hypothetical protein
MVDRNESRTPQALLLDEVARGAFDDAAERLLAAARGENAWDREHAFAAARTILDSSGLIEPLITALGAGDRPERRNAARSALAQLARPDALDHDRALLALSHLAAEDPDIDVRILAATALGESGNPAAREILERVVRDPEPNIASAAADALGVLGDPQAIDALAAAADATEFWVRLAAVVALGNLRDPRALPVLARALDDPATAEAAA